MSSSTDTSPAPKKRRIMIITADESIIEQLQSSNNASLLKSIVLDPNDDGEDVSHALLTNMQVETPSSTNKKPKQGSLTCVVCGSAANGYNFDAITCESCKAFFRRNALKDPVRTTGDAQHSQLVSVFAVGLARMSPWQHL